MVFRNKYLKIFILIFFTVIQGQDNWPHWRGPSQNGISSATYLPVEWSEVKNIIWKIPLPSWSAATPIIWEDRIFITSPSEVISANNRKSNQLQTNQRRRVTRNPGGSKILLICISKKNGSVIWQTELDVGNKFHRKQNSASPSPVTDGKYVWVVTGTGVVTALDMQGNKIWKKSLPDEYGNFGLKFGYASSPVIHNGKLIIQVIHGYFTDKPSYIVALNATTGKEYWRKTRSSYAEGESLDAYTTPALLSIDGKTQIIISGGDVVTGNDFDSGEEIWRVAGLNPRKRQNYRIISSPTVTDRMIYVPTRKTPLLALKVNPSGKLTDKDISWMWEGNAAPDVPTPICDGKYFYMVDDKGRISCLNAINGQLIWGPEQTTSGIVSASPLLADGKIYITNEKAVTAVLMAGEEFKLLSINELEDDYTLASLAVSKSHLFMRTSRHLYCIGQ
jgi:outer membrane protein assembly factor BamB